MKIRQDYVSNSSSSSFMVVGVAFNGAELIDIAKNKGLVKPNEDGEIEESADEVAYLLEESNRDLGLSFNRGISDYYDMFCIGLGYSSMKSSETKKEFENRISEKLQILTGKKEKVEELVDGGYDN